jgi:Tfp pilus assembly protein PilF
MPSAHLQLANLYLKRHQMAAASSELQAYLRANPSGPAGTGHQENAGQHRR